MLKKSQSLSKYDHQCELKKKLDGIKLSYKAVTTKTFTILLRCNLLEFVL